jgi:hypothetical protein
MTTTAGIRDWLRRKAPTVVDEAQRYDKSVHEVGKRLRTAVKPLATTIATQIARVAHQNNLPAAFLPYLYFLLDRRHQDWPTLNPSLEKALKAAMRLLDAEEAMPVYSRNIQTPPPMMEALVDLIILELAEWASKGLRARASKLYLRILEQVAAKMGPVPGDPEDFLHELFVYDLKEHPQQFDDPVLLWRMVNHLIGV